MKEKAKRSRRRYDAELVLKRRIKKYLDFNIHVIENYRFTGEYITSNAEKERYVREGRGFRFLRTTSNPCNCYMCSYEKYRNNRAKENRKAQKDIGEQVL